MSENFKLSNLVCGACKQPLTIPRKRGKQKGAGHVKHMYCPHCKAIRPFVENSITGKNERFWAINNLVDLKDLSKHCVIYDPEDNLILTKDNQMALISKELYNYDKNITVENGIKRLENEGYVVHVLTTDRPAEVGQTQEEAEEEVARLKQTGGTYGDF